MKQNTQNNQVTKSPNDKAHRCRDKNAPGSNKTQSRHSVQRLVRSKTFSLKVSDKNGNQLFDCSTFEGSHTMPSHHQKMVRIFMVGMLKKLHNLKIINQPLNVEISLSASSSDKSSSNKTEKYCIPST